MIENLHVEETDATFLLLQPSVKDKENEPLKVKIANSKFIGNFGRDDGLIIGKTNSRLEVVNTSFVNNYSLGRGSILLGEEDNHISTFRESTFVKNYAIDGGIAYI